VPSGNEFVGVAWDTVLANGDRLAVLTHGSVHVHGSLMATGDVIVPDGLGGWASLTDLVRVLRDQAATECPEAACVHGMARSLTDCTCACFGRWTGSRCDEHDCFGRRQSWDAALQRCACTGDWLPEYQCAARYCASIPGLLWATEPNDNETCPAAATATGTSPTCHDRGFVDTVTGQCVCTEAGVLGPTCEHACATLAIDAGECLDLGGRPIRGNWGHDAVPTATEPFGVCGGGYTGSPTVVAVSALACPANTTIEECQARWTAESPRCCAPGVSCTPTGCAATDGACCEPLRHADTCAAAGCAWCPVVDGSHVCAARAYANPGDCAVPIVLLDTEEVGPGWTTWQYACPADRAVAGTLCDPATRVGYLSEYALACDTGTDPLQDPAAFSLHNANLTCLAAARAAINTRAWPALAAGAVDTGMYARISTSTAAAAAGCVAAERAWFGMLPAATQRDSRGGPAVWTCGERAPSGNAFRIRLAPPETAATDGFLVDGTAGYLMIETTDGAVFCLANAPVDTETARQVFGLAGATATGVWLRAGLQPAATGCGQFRLDVNELLVPDWTLGLAPNQTYADGQVALTLAGAARDGVYVPAQWSAAPANVTIERIS
jgi:hypothetical protein